MQIIIKENYEQMSAAAAQIVAAQVYLKPSCVLGLATGSTPKGLYQELISLHKNANLDFSQVKSFNLDEYYGLEKSNDQSYDYFMRENLFNHINIKPENTHIPNGLASNIQAECDEYDAAIAHAGGIDLQVLGIGANAHIGFNEPAQTFTASTHLVQLSQKTIDDNARFFTSIEQVPKSAITMGLKSIMQAKKIVLLASGANKAQAIYDMLRGQINPQVPASMLQIHSDLVVVLDKDAASML